jgi:hypothetical protein
MFATYMFQHSRMIASAIDGDDESFAVVCYRSRRVSRLDEKREV